MVTLSFKGAAKQEAATLHNSLSTWGQLQIRVLIVCEPLTECVTLILHCHLILH